MIINKIILILAIFLVASAIVDGSEYVFYSYGPNGLIAKTQGSETYFYHKDHLGSNAIVSNSSGGVEYSSDYYPFGESFNSEGEEKYSYTGKEKDSSGLYYYGARYYDASLGRFISVDPVYNVLFSSYVYVRDNPMKYVDPTGEVPVEIIEESFKNGQGVPLSGFNLDLPEKTLEEFRMAGFEPSVMHSGGSRTISMSDVINFVVENIDISPKAGYDFKVGRIEISVKGLGSATLVPVMPGFKNEEEIGIILSIGGSDFGLNIFNEAVEETTWTENGEVEFIITDTEISFEPVFGQEIVNGVGVEVSEEGVGVDGGYGFEYGDIELNLYEEEFGN